MIALLPRLSTPSAVERMALYAGMGSIAIAVKSAEDLGTLPVTFGTGGSRIDTSAARLAELAGAIRSIATRAGYPEPAKLEGQQQFDRDTALLLREHLTAGRGELIRAETWQFMAAGLLPDVVVWRWSDDGTPDTVSEDRFIGGSRNCFGRLWLRAIVFWDDRLEDPSTPLRLLREDNYTQILERSAFAAHHPLCREAARAFLLRRPLVEGTDDANPTQALLRDAMRRVIRVAAYSALWSLDSPELVRQFATLFDAALRAVSVSPRPEAQLAREQPALALAASAGQIPDTPDRGSSTTEPGGPSPVPLAIPVEAEHVDWLDLSGPGRTTAVWRTLIGQGEGPEAELVRISAQALRDSGQLSFERLREGGPVFRGIQDAIDRGVRVGCFDRPGRGLRRAIAQTVEAIPLVVLRGIILDKLSEGIPEESAVPVLATHIRTVCGLTDGAGTHEQVSALLRELISGGHIVQEGDVLIPAEWPAARPAAVPVPSPTLASMNKPSVETTASPPASKPIGDSFLSKLPEFQPLSRPFDRACFISFVAGRRGAEHLTRFLLEALRKASRTKGTVYVQLDELLGDDRPAASRNPFIPSEPVGLCLTGSRNLVNQLGVGVLKASKSRATGGHMPKGLRSLRVWIVIQDGDLFLPAEGYFQGLAEPLRTAGWRAWEIESSLFDHRYGDPAGEWLLEHSGQAPAPS